MVTFKPAILPALCTEAMISDKEVGTKAVDFRGGV